MHSWDGHKCELQAEGCHQQMSIASALIYFANVEIMHQVKESFSKGFYFVPVKDAW